jgi:hypothetical protein
VFLDQETLARITVNYLRHERTDCDRLLAALHGRIGKNDAIELVRERVYTMIAETYPDLEDECDRQEEVRSDAMFEGLSWALSVSPRRFPRQAPATEAGDGTSPQVTAS